MATISDLDQVLDQHMVLDLQCLDRIYLNAYVPTLQVGGQVVTFLTRHLGYPIPSPALFANLGNDVRKAVKTFARRHAIPCFSSRSANARSTSCAPSLSRPPVRPAWLRSVSPRSSSRSWWVTTAPPSPARFASGFGRPSAG